MKKVKTIITSLLIILASALMTACSCAGAGTTNPDEIIHVYATGISISSTFPGVKKDDDGFLHIDCRLNDEIKITYELTPTNVTTTQVQWDIVEGDDIITCKSTVDTYSNSRTHTVTFVANRNKIGETEIVFKTATDQVTRAYITVNKNHEILPTFVEVTGVNYVPSTNKIVWNPVTEQRLYTGPDQIVPAEKDPMGAVRYLEGYEVKITNLTTDKEYGPYKVTKNEFPLQTEEYSFGPGNAYAIKVRALGDALETDGQGANVNSGSFQKEAYKFMQLATATDLSSDNGFISYQAPLHSTVNKIYYNKSDSSMYINRSVDSLTESKKDEFGWGLLNKSLTDYDISIVSYPEGFDSSKGYAEDVDTKIKYYPSAKSEEIHIKRLEAPRIAFTDRQEVLTIKDPTKGDITFGTGSDNKPYISSILTWSTNTQYEQAIYNARFVYEIIKINKLGNQTSVVKYGQNADHSSHKQYDTQQLLDTTGAGTYKLVVYTTGNKNNTIESDKVEYNFSLLDKINALTTVFEDNVLTTNQASSNIAGVDLFFVHLSDTTKSFHKYVSAGDGSNYGRNNVSIDLRTLTDLVPGNYNVYGRFVGQKGDGSSQNTTSATGNLVQLNSTNKPIKVASPVSCIEMTSEGIIKFTNVDGISEYIIQVKKGTSHFVTVTLSKAEGNYTLDNLYRSFGTPKYTQYVDNGVKYNALNYLDLLGYASKDNSNFDQSNPDNFFEGLLKKTTGDSTNYEQFSFNLITKGSEVNTGVDSKESNSASFQKCKPVNELTLKNNNLSFISVGVATYVLDINGYKFSKTYTVSVGNTISVNLTTEKVDGTETPLIDCIEKDKNPVIKVHVIGQTGSTESNIPCLLDSNQSSQSFHVTQKPTSLFAEENGNIVWSSPTSSNLRNFVLRIYDLAGNMYDENGVVVEDKENYEGISITATRYTHPEPTPSTPESGDDPVDESSNDTNDPDPTTDEYYYNINNLMSKIYLEKGNNITLAITIQEVDAGKFTGYESEKYYVVKLPTVTLSKIMDGEDPAIEASVITLVDGIKYNLSIVKDGDIANTSYILNQDVPTSAERVIYSIRNKLNISNIGKYVISLYSNRDNKDIVNTQSTPFVISSEESKIEVSVQPSKIATTTDGTNVKWNSIHSDATYTVAYRKDSDTQYTEITREATDLKNTTCPMPSDIDSDTLYWVRVIPSIDYISTGIILSADNAIDNKVIKLSQASDMGTENGKLVFNFIDSSVANLIASNKDANISDYIVVNVMIDGQNISESTYTVTSEIIYESQTAVVDEPGSEPEDNPEDDPETEPETPPTPTTKAIGVKFIIDITSVTHNGEKSYSVQLKSKKHIDGNTGYLHSNPSDEYKATKIGTASVSKDDFFKNGKNIEWKLIDNATHYQLKFVQTSVDPDGKEPIYINFEYDETNGTIMYEAVENGEKTYVSNNVEIKNGKVLYTFDEESCAPGDYAYTLTAFTTKERYLNGNTSTELTLTKLDNQVTIEAIDNNIAISGYSPVGSVIPSSITYTISRIQFAVEGEKTVIETIGDPIGTKEPISFADIQDQITYSASGAIEPASDDTETQAKGPFMINLDKIGFSEAGDYMIKLQFIGDNNSIISSNIFEYSGLTRLNITTPYTHTGVITWNAVEGASSYSVKITDSNDTQNPVEIKNPKISTTDGENSTTIVQLLESDIAEIFTFGIDQEYIVQIMANGTSTDNVQCLSSTWSDGFTVKKLTAPTGLEIKRFDGTSNAQSMLVWTESNTVVNNDGFEYILKYDGDKNDPELYIETLDLDSAKTMGIELLKEIDGEPIPVDKYTLYLKVIGNSTIGTDQMGLLTSNYSTNGVTIEYVNEVEGITFNGKTNQYTWNFDGVADAYKLTFSQPGETDYVTYVSKSKEYIFRNTELNESGFYTLTVNAVTDPTKSIISATNDNNSTELYVTNSVNNVFVKDGRLAWTVAIADVQAFITGAKLDYDSVINSIQSIINSNQEPSDDAKMLSHLYNFRLNLNGKEVSVKPTSVQVEGINLLYEYDITNANPDTLTLTPSYAYQINVSAIGNGLNSNKTDGIISTTDGRYNSEILLTAYKPMTPQSWINNGKDPVQISEGNLLWKLVTNEDSTSTEFKYHSQYRITLTHEGDETTPDDRIEDVTVDLNQTLESTGFTQKNLSELFPIGSNIKYNTNYYPTISVIGTADSRGKTGNFYFNSDTFKYSENFNRLQNDIMFVKNSVYEWVPCEDSTATRVIIYGPFDYAPDKDDYKANGTFDETAYNNALEEWKKGIQSEFTTKKLELEFLADADRITKYSLNKEILSSYGFTYEESVAEKYKYNRNFDPGSYIIRRQELGNGRGIISAYINEDNLFSEGEPDYGVIVTKLDQATAKQTKQVNNNQEEGKTVDVPVWVENGRFVWNEVSNANAYSIKLMKVKVENTFDDKGNPVQNIIDDGSVSEDCGIVTNTYYDMPEKSDFNDPGFSYKIVIGALRVEDDLNITDNYFNGDTLSTLAYVRVNAPKENSINVNGSGIVSWNIGYEGESYIGYGIKINAGEETIYENDDLGKDVKTFDLTTINYAGSIAFYVRARAIDEMLNSIYLGPLWVTKLTNPELHVTDGVFNWKMPNTTANDPTPISTFNLDVGTNRAEPVNINEYDGNSYPLYTDIIDYDQKYVASEDAYPAGEYTFTVQFNGDEEYDPNKTFNIASRIETLTATKLGYPIIESRDASDANAQESGNRIVWNKIDNASGYRVRVIAKTETITEKGETIALFKTVTIDNLNIDDKSQFFEESGNQVAFKLAELFKANVGTERYIESKDGLEIKVYVQAIGSLDDGTKYLSSSYSDCKVITIPSAPIGHDYNSDKGIISWDLEDATNKHNAILTLEYTVSGVTLDEYRNYWQLLTEQYPEISVIDGNVTGATVTPDEEDMDKSSRSSDIIYRKITSATKGDDGTYTLTVVDTVFLRGSTGHTPTEYQLTHTAQYNKISVVITASDDPEYKGEYQSMPYEITGYGAENKTKVSFEVFASGDGSTLLPYQIADVNNLNGIKYFTDKHFLITQDINVSNNWTMITDEFTGSITGKLLDGNRYPNIATIKMNRGDEYDTSSYGENKILNLAFMYSIAVGASISNLNFNLAYSLSGAYDNSYVYVAGLAINNSGTIKNVNIDKIKIDENTIYNSTIYVKISNDLELKVAGMVLNNYGSIIDSSVSVGNNDIKEINKKDDDYYNQGIFALDGASSTKDSYVYAQATGIAGVNYGKIISTYFSGDITSNYIGGISGTNRGIIDRCYVEGNAYLVNCGSSSSNDIANHRDMVYGGISIELNDKENNSCVEIDAVQIINSYSIMKVTVYRQLTNAGNCNIGGLVYYIDGNEATIQNNYVILDITNEANNDITDVSIIPLGENETGITYENNYYVISASKEITIPSPVKGYKENMTALKSALDTNIYNTTVEDHPVHNNMEKQI